MKCKCTVVSDVENIGLPGQKGIIYVFVATECVFLGDMILKTMLTFKLFKGKPLKKNEKNSINCKPRMKYYLLI